MKTLKLLILMMMILPCTAYAYEGSDNSDKLSNGSSSVFSPGYINAAKQKTEAIVGQLDPKKSFMERLVDNIKSGTANNVDETADSKATIEIKKKTSAKNVNQVNITPIAGDDSIKIGSGDNQEYVDGRLISEFFDGNRYVYAGFDDVGMSAISSATFYASQRGGGNVIVKGWDPTDYHAVNYIDGVILYDSVNLFGGYNELGERDTIGTPSNINIHGIQTFLLTDTIEMSGFNIGLEHEYYLRPDGWMFNPADPIPNGARAFHHDSYFDIVNNRVVSESDVDLSIVNLANTGPGKYEITANRMAPALLNPYENRSLYNYDYDSSRYLETSTKSGLTLGLNADKVSSIFKGLLESKSDLAAFGTGQIDPAMITRILKDSFQVSALSLPMGNSTPEMQIAMALANILKNPTEDQKAILDAITSLLKDVANAEGENGKSDELTKAENDLLQMAAAVLLAQGIPDLLKEGDVENMKGMFKDLGASKDKVLLDYKDSIKPYYNNIAKEIAANIAVLETKGMIKKNLTEEQLKKLEPREIDRILENIRKNNDKSFELEYLLQQDSKYRKEYLDPSKKLMEDNMKLILGSFAKKLSEALEEKK